MALRLRGNSLCCADVLGILKLYFPTLLLAGELSAGEARPLSTPPSPLSTIHLRLPRVRNVAQDTVGLVPNPLLAHFTRAFTNWPPSHGCCCLGFGSKGSDRGPPFPQFLMLCCAPAPHRRLHHRRSRNPGVGAGSLRSQLYLDTQHYGDVCLCYDPGCKPFIPSPCCSQPIQAGDFLWQLLTRSSNPGPQWCCTRSLLMHHLFPALWRGAEHRHCRPTVPISPGLPRASRLAS